MINPFSFFTLHQILLLFFLKYLGIQQRHLVLVCILILANSIHGSFLLHKYIQDASQHYNLPQYWIYLCDILTHWFVGICILRFIFLDISLTWYDILLNLIIALLGIGIYLYHFSPQDVYIFSNMSNLHLIRNHFFVISILVACLILQNKTRKFWF